jgi:hypothetical protein
MDHAPTTEAERWREYHITPRYLAGSSESGEPALGPLLNLGWNRTYDHMHNVYVSAPDQTVRLGYLPEGPDDALWKITAYSDPFALPRWLVTFQESTPTEIVTDFTTALATAYSEGPDSYLYYGNSNPVPLDVGAPLATAGWSHRFGHQDVSFRSPDGLAEVHLRGALLDHGAEMSGLQERWLLRAGPPGDQWYATASSFTPDGLVAAMTSAVANPAPVIRYGDDLRHLPPQATAIPVKPVVPTPLDLRRAQAARARSPHTLPASGDRPPIPAPPQPPAPYRSHRPGPGR